VAPQVPSSFPIDTYADWVRFYGQHFVSLSGTYIAVDPQGKRIGNEEIFLFSGFVVLLGNHWFFVTAGHVFRDDSAQEEKDWGLDRLRDAGKIEILQCGLKDDFGSCPKFSGQTFVSYETLPRWYLYDKELAVDFAVVYLRDLYRKSLEKNGVVPITEAMWGSQPDNELDAHILLGLPTEGRQPTVSTQTYFGDSLMARISPMLVYIEQTGRPHRKLLDSDFSWLVGKVHTEVFALKGIEGMSGGPIFGLKKTNDGESRYWLVALQSWWDPDTCTVYGCRASVFHRFLQELMLQDLVLCRGPSEIDRSFARNASKVQLR
jgi:hypothetical protein